MMRPRVRYSIYLSEDEEIAENSCTNLTRHWLWSMSQQELGQLHRGLWLSMPSSAAHRHAYGGEMRASCRNRSPHHAGARREPSSIISYRHRRMNTGRSMISGRAPSRLFLACHGAKKTTRAFIEMAYLLSYLSGRCAATAIAPKASSL